MHLNVCMHSVVFMIEKKKFTRLQKTYAERMILDILLLWFYDKQLQ